MQSLPHLGLTLGSNGLFCSLVQGVVGRTKGILTDPGCVFDRLWFTVSLELEFDGISNSFIALLTERCGGKQAYTFNILKIKSI